MHQKLTDELAAEISNNEYKTAEAYNNYIKEDLEKTKKENQHNQELNDLVALAYQNATVNDYPAGNDRLSAGAGYLLL